MSIIVVNELKKSFGKKEVLNNLSFNLEPKQSLGIIGGSGSGKSVLLRCILGLMPIDHGTILINGQDMAGANWKTQQQILSKIGMLFQGGALFDSLTIWKNVAFQLLYHEKMCPKQARSIALDKINAVDLDEKVADIYPAELSGGMQKRVALARAIATNPSIIFFDEPTAGLDPIVSGIINQLIRRCVNDLGAAAITITHDMHSLHCVADHVGLLFKGHFVWKGAIKQLDTTDDPYVVQFINGNPCGPFTQ